MKKIKIITSKEKKKSCRLLALSIITSILFPSYSFAEDAPQQCPAVIKQLDDSEIEIARQAWKYFDNNFQKTTGLVNAVDGYPSTTLWDSGSSMAAFITAEKMGIITSEQFHKIVKSTLYTLATLDQFNGRAPNKVYNTETAEKVDYANKYSEQGIGISILDLARITSWLNILSCLYPEHKEDAEKVLESWSYCELFDKGEMYGMGIPEEAGESKLLQEGRLGYEQYAAKVFKNLGFKLDHSADYRNKHTDTVKIYDIPISVDKRDSATLGAYNYVVTESYVMDIIENGRDDVLKSLTKNIFKVQEQRWKKTDQVTAVSEDNLDQAPYFVYNTIYTDGENWKALTDTGEDMAPLKTVSTKAAFSMAYVFPEEEYSKVLMDIIKDAKNPKGGWYSGVYEKNGKFNKATTANTNGVILSTLLYKMYGSLTKLCKDCNKGVVIKPETLEGPQDKEICKAELPKRIEKAQKVAKQSAVKRKANIFLASLDKIWASYDLLNQAEEQANSGNTTKATEILEQAKGKIWGLGDSFSEDKESFHKLMGPADGLMASWKSGDAKAAPAELNNALVAAAGNICSRQMELDPGLKAMSDEEGFCRPKGYTGKPFSVSSVVAETTKNPVVEQLAKISDVIKILDEANELYSKDDAEKALSLTKKCKDDVWGLGDKLADHKKEFHDMMGSFDYTMGEWKKGEKGIDTAGIQDKLRENAQKVCELETKHNPDFKPPENIKLCSL